VHAIFFSFFSFSQRGRPGEIKHVGVIAVSEDKNHINLETAIE
jgi:hypothetical protein